METNILGLPSLTGYTPLKAAREGQVLKYDFKEIGPIVMDKSGNGNLGKLKPIKDPPRRKIVSWFPLKVVMNFDGEDDYVIASPLNNITNLNEVTIIAGINFQSCQHDAWKDFLSLQEGYSESRITLEKFRETPKQYGWVIRLKGDRYDAGNFTVEPHGWFTVGMSASLSQNFRKTYVNGSLISTKNGWAEVSGTFDFYVVGPSSNVGSQVTVGSVKIFNRALSDDEMKELA